ncbi:hypothetical protein MMC07_004277 [Pseudocyphellaria aurata]|nr:hypothetical protein [Pseudocyphellaria aurata]
MEKDPTQSPQNLQTLKPHGLTLPFPKRKSYAMVDDAVIERVKFLMTKLEPVNMEELDPDNRVCSICQEELVVSEDAKPSHTPVRTICGHIFGKTCVIRWFDPLKVWALHKCNCGDRHHEPDSDRPHHSDVDDDHGYDYDELDGDRHHESDSDRPHHSDVDDDHVYDHDELEPEYDSDESESEYDTDELEDELEDENNPAVSEPGRAGCPICRRAFFPRCIFYPMEIVSQSIFFWDMVYASAGVARSENEESSRAYLLQYIEYCRSIDDNTLDFRLHWYDILVDLQELLVSYARFLKHQGLTPEQEILRKKLERIARKDLKKCTFENGRYDFNIESDDNERDEFKKHPLKEDEKVPENEGKV